MLAIYFLLKKNKLKKREGNRNFDFHRANLYIFIFDWKQQFWRSRI